VIRKATGLLNEGGSLVLRRRAGRYVRRKLSGHGGLDLPVAAEDVLAAHARRDRPNSGDENRVELGPMTIDWVIPPIAAGAGGHRTILRFVKLLGARGHTSRIAVYDGRGIQTAAEAEVIIQRHFGPLDVEVLDGVAATGRCDALVATGWQTAYPVVNTDTTARKFYFVQDYEPYFFPMGSASVLAEDTYRFGLYGITAGRWLADKLGDEFGMRSAYFDFGSDGHHYRHENPGRRRKVVFYARPNTPRRGFELGLLALMAFARRRPEFEIHLVGGDLKNHWVPDGFVTRGVLTPTELNQLYNESAAALVISLTNMSLLPLELLASGCIPVVNDSLSNTGVSDNPFIAYTDPSPAALAARLDEMVSRPDLPEYSRAAADSVKSLTWEDAADQVEAALRHGPPSTDRLAPLSASVG
jgi:glycosyltransferase involved in cell wall biosynthesis